MKLSSMITLLCIMAMVTITIAAPSVTMTWESDFFIRAEEIGDKNPGTNQLRIKLTDVPLPLSFSAALTTEEVDAGVDLTIYQLTFPDQTYLNLHQNSVFHCVDATTYQLIASLSFDSGSFTISPLPIFFLDWIYTVELLCPMSIKNDNAPQSTNIDILYPNAVSGDTETISTTLDFPAKGFIRPTMDFKSLSLGKSPHPVAPSTTIDIEFTTDTAGVYSVTSVNNYKLTGQLEFSDKMNSWCSAGKETKFAVIRENKIFITEPTTEIIKCRFHSSSYTGTSEVFVASNRISIVIQLVSSPFSISRSIDHDLAPGYFHFDLRLQSATSADLYFIAINQMTSTPINTNSTIELKFSNSLNVASLFIQTSNGQPDQQDYRGYDCGTFTATISVDTKANTITLKDISNPAPPIPVSCQFFFRGSNIAKFGEELRQSSSSVKIDGKSLISLLPEKTQKPIHFVPSVDIERLDDQITETDTTITIVNSFIVSDKYSTHFTTLGHPIALFSLHGDANFSEDQRETQLACTATSPVSTVVNNMVFTFDKDLGLWRAELDDIKDIETFHIKIACTRTVNKMIKFGRNITPIPSLVVNIIDLIDENRFVTFQGVVFGYPVLTPITKQTQQYPEKSALYADFTVPLSLPQNSLTDQTQQSITNAIQSIITDKITPSTALTTYTLSTISIGQIMISELYYSLPVESEFYEYLTNILGSVVEVNSLDMSPSLLSVYLSDRYPYNIIDTLESYGQQAVMVQVRYKTDVTKAQWDVPETRQDLSVVDLIRDIYTTAEWMKNRLSEVTIFPGGQFVPGYSFYSPIGKCGYESGVYFSTNEIDQSYAPISSSQEDVDAAWDAFQEVDVQHYRCPLGETCSINADCVSGNCTGGVCVAQQRFPLPYVHWLDVFSLNSRDRYNSSMMVTTIGAIIIAIVAIIF